MRPAALLPAALLLAAAAAGAQAVDWTAAGDRWWRHVEVLAADDMGGRLTGSPEHARAVAYVANRFRDYGLRPAGTEGYRQPVRFEQQLVDPDRSAAALVTGGQAAPLRVGTDMLVSAGGGPRPARVEAPLVFAGYGLHLPEAEHDDLAGLDLRGRIVVVVSGGPATLSGALKSHARRELARLVAERGALGVLSISTAKAVETPWARQAVLARQPGMYLADPTLRDTARPMLAASFDPAQGQRLFEGSGHDWAEIQRLADASAPVPRFPLRPTLRAAVAATRTPLVSDNVVGLLPGSDPRLKAEHVVVSAHVDGHGTAATGEGDRILNGAIDNASGVASLLEIARRYREEGARPKRSILFVVVTAEEKGLLGSRYFAARPTVPPSSLVADINYDMALPLWKLDSVLMHGAPESSLGPLARTVAAEHGLGFVADPFPDRNVFTRSDQYSFIRAGVPSLFVKFGFRAGTPQAVTEGRWRSTVYHSPGDDLAQPVEKAEAAKLDRYVGDLVLRIADAPARPTWNPDSLFRRFAP